MPNALACWAIRARHLLSHVFEHWLWRYRYFWVKLTFETLTVRGQQHSFSTHERRVICNNIHYKMSFEITYPFLNLKYSRWRLQMETFFALMTLCAWNSPVTGEFHAQRPVTRSFDVFFEAGEAGDCRRHRPHHDVTVMCSDLQFTRVLYPRFALWCVCL